MNNRTLLRVLILLPFLLFAVTASRAQKPELVLQTGHLNTVRAIAISPDGKYIASTGADKSIILWEIATSRQLYSLEGHVEWIFTLTFSPDGKLLASGSSDGIVKLWNIDDGKEEHQVSLLSSVNFIAFSPDGNRLAIANKDKLIRLWDIRERKIKAELSGHTGQVSKVAFAPEGKHLLSSSWDGTLRMWDLATGKSEVFLDFKVRMKSFAYSGSFIACADDWVVSVISRKDGKLKLDIPHERTLESNSFAFISDKELALIDGFKLRIWDVEAGKEKQVQDSSGYALSVNPDATLLAFSHEETINLLNLKTKVIRVLKGRLCTVNAIAFSWDGKAIFASLGNELGVFGNLMGLSRREGFITAMSLENRSRVFSPATGEIAHFKETDHGKRINDIVLIDTSKQKSRYVLRGHTKAVKSIAVNPKGTMLASIGEDGTLILWDIKKRTPLKTLKETAELLAFSSDGEILAAVIKDGTIKLWNVKTAKNTVLPSRGGIDNVLFSPDGKTLATMGVSRGKRILNLWEVSSGQHLRPLSADSTPEELIQLWGNLSKEIVENAFYQSAGVLFQRALDSLNVSGPMAFSRDNRFIACEAINRATANYDIKVWNAQTGELVHTLTGHRSSIASIAFSPNGNVLASGSLDGTLKLWNARSGKELATIVPLNEDDWIVYTPDGRFDTNTSLDDVERLHWIIPGDALNALPLDIFMRDYYEPKLLGRILAGAALKPVRDISTLNRTQPEVGIKEVKPDGANTVQVTVEVANAVSRKQFDANERALQSGVYDVRLFRDGQMVANSTAETALETYIKATGDQDQTTGFNETELRLWQQAHQVQLDENGRRTFIFHNIKVPQDGKAKEVVFSAYAFNNDRVKGSTARATYARPPMPSRPHKGRAYIVTVGVNLYENPDFKLSYAANDARQIEQALTSRLTATGQYEEVVPVSLISDPRRGEDGTVKMLTDATKANFRAVLRLLSGKDGRTSPEMRNIPNADKLKTATPDDFVLIFFAGHAFTGSKGFFYLIPYDTGPGHGVTSRLEQHSISSDELSLWIRGVDAGHLTLIVDACHSAAAVESAAFKPGPMGSRGLGQLAYDKGMLILTATQADNLAHEDDRIGQGLLSYVLVREGLEGKQADFDPADGVITLREWLQYGVANVPRLFQEIVDGKTTIVKRDVFVDSAGQPRGDQQQPSLFDFARRRADVTLVRGVAPRQTR